MTLAFNFQGQIWNLLYLSPKWSNCHETKSKHIDGTQGSKHINWTQSFKCAIGFGHTFDLDFLKSNMDFAISYPKMVWLSPNEKQRYSNHIDWTLGFECDQWGWPWLFRNDLDLEFSRSNMEFALSQPKMIWLSRNENQTLISRLQMWPLGLPLAMTLILNCLGPVETLLYLSQKWSEHWLNASLKCDQWDQSVTLIFNLQDQIWNLLYLMTKWSDCYKTKNERITWTLGLKWSHYLRLLSWLLPWNFNVKFLNSCISGVAAPIDVKPKWSKSMGCWANNVTVTFDHMLGLDHVFSWSNFQIAVSQEWERWLILNKWHRCQSFKTMTVTKVRCKD